MIPVANSIKSKLLMAGIIICTLGIAVFGISIYNEWQEENASVSEYDALTSVVAKEKDVPDTVNIRANADANTTVVEEVPIEIDFKNLPERGDLQGDAIIGWIYSEDTVINYPVVQGDDNSFYLTHLYNGKKGQIGSIFMDYRNNAWLTDKNTVLYGHHVRSGRMFSSLENYKKQDYYDKHNVLYYINDDGYYKLEVFAGVVMSGENEVPRSFENDDEFVSYIAELKEKSTFKSNVEIDKNDRIMTLCTCTYDFANARYMLFGKLVKVRYSNE